MVNTYLDIRLKDEDGKKKIDEIFFCTNGGARKVSAQDALCRNDDNSNKPKYINFGFSNLCYNYPYRIIIADEIVPPSGEYEWLNGANFNLMYAYYRLTQMLGDSLPPRIDYNTLVYFQMIFKISNVNGIEYLCVPTRNITSSPTEGSQWSPGGSYPPAFILFPLIFKLAIKKDLQESNNSSEVLNHQMYIAYNPPIGLCDTVGSSSGPSYNQYYPEGFLSRIRNESIITDDVEHPAILNFPVYKINKGHQIWNIDLDKLNIGYEVARYIETY